MEHKYIKIVKQPKNPKRKTDIYAVINKNSKFVLGYIKWFPSWRQYCFFPEGDTVFSAGCIQDILNFIEEVKNYGDGA